MCRPLIYRRSVLFGVLLFVCPLDNIRRFISFTFTFFFLGIHSFIHSRANLQVKQIYPSFRHYLTVLNLFHLLSFAQKKKERRFSSPSSFDNCTMTHRLTHSVLGKNLSLKRSFFCLPSLDSMKSKEMYVIVICYLYLFYVTFSR